MHPAIITMLAAWGFVIVWITGVIMAERKHHPKALFVLFFTELWERFSYYGMRALLILYMTKALLYGDTNAYGIYGAYGALVYATPVLGGFLADRFLGYRKAIMLGAVLMALGHFALAFEFEYIFYLALGFLIIGNGFFKPNISSLIGTFYEKGDRKRDAAFTLFYMGINTGAFLTPLTVGAIGELYGWHWGFGIAGVGMLLGLIIFLYGGKKGYYFDKGLAPVKKDSLKKETDWSIYIIIGAFLSVPLFALLVNQNEFSKYLLYIVGFAVLIILLILAFMEKQEARERLFVILILFAFSTMFWTFFELAGSAVTLFTDRNVDRKIFGYLIPTSSFQGVNPFFIIVLAPLFAWIWEKTAKMGREPSDPMKFSLSLIQLGVGFGMFVIGAKLAGPNALAPMIFLVLGYLFHTTGELCMSPIGLSLVTKLSPGKIVAFVMGVWLMSTSFAHLLGSEISKITTLPSEEVSGPVSQEILQLGLKTYSDVFEVIAYISIASGILLIFFVPKLKKWMHGIK